LYFIVSAFSLSTALLTSTFGFSGYSTFYWLNIFYLSVVVGTLGTTFYFISAKEIGSVRTGSFTFLVPLFALFLSWLILGERPHISSIIGGGFALCAVYLINYKSRFIQNSEKNSGGL
jgi:drug/metabolite transporter (DMT)-like permease